MATINIKSVDGDTVPFEGIDLSITVDAFKGLIEEKLSKPKSTQRIIFQGRVLSADQTLADAGITDGVQVHLISISASRAAPPAAPAAAAVTPARTPNLFGGDGGGGGGGGMPGGGLGGAADLESVSALLSTPQGQAMVQAVLQNPEALLQRFPELRNNPEFATAMQQIASNPQAFQQLMQEQAQRASNPIPIPRSIFDVAMDVMNGAEMPDEFAIDIPGAGGRAGPRAAAASSGPREEFITRDQIAAALDSCIPLLPPAPGAGPVATPSSSTGDVASDVATQGSVDVAPLADVPEPTVERAAPEPAAPEPAAPEPAAPEPAASEPAAPEPAVPTPAVAAEQTPMEGVTDAPATGTNSPFAAQLEQMRAMGFANDATSLQALEAAGGDVMTAVTFLTDM